MQYEDQSLAIVMSRQVTSPNHTFFLGKLDLAVYQYFVHILSIVTDNNRCWISGRWRMTVDIISWSTSEKVWDQAGIELVTPEYTVRLPTEYAMGLWGVYCEFWSMESEQWSVKYDQWSVKYELKNVKYDLWTSKGYCTSSPTHDYEMWSMNCDLWSVKYDRAVWTLKCEIWSAKY